MDMTDRPAAAKRRLPRLGLSGKLLVLTTLFVMIAEVLIYVPSVASFRLTWLNDRLSAAYTAALANERKNTYVTVGLTQGARASHHRAVASRALTHKV